MGGEGRGSFLFSQSGGVPTHLVTDHHVTITRARGGKAAHKAGTHQPHEGGQGGRQAAKVTGRHDKCSRSLMACKGNGKGVSHLPQSQARAARQGQHGAGRQGLQHR